MSLAWQVNASSLLQIGFSAGDIAILAGAGRAIVTWLTAKSKDAALLEYLGVDADTLIERTGLVDTTELKDRWGKDLKLFLDGKCRQYPNKDPATTELGKFSWVLTLISAALHVSLTTNDFNDVLTNFVLGLFDDHPSQEHLRHELDMHISGWQSFATVHKILDVAREEWQELARSGVHPVGCIPRSDSGEILTFLKWLTKEKQGKRFITASSDVFSLASILQKIGIADVRTHKNDDRSEPDFEEKHLVVILTTGATRSTSDDTQVVRKGMPIPLERPEDIIHFWPYERSNHSNPLQELFIRGMSAAEGLQFTLDVESEIPFTATTTNQTVTDLFYTISSTIAETKLQLTGRLKTVAYTFFPLLTEDTRKALMEIAHESIWKPSDSARDIKDAICQNRKFHGMLQSFVMGYYYAALARLIDTSQMSTTEAFGSWGWWDYEVLEVVRDLKHDTPPASKSSIRCWRFGLMKVAAYLFAGAPTELIRRLDNRATGVIAKLCLLTASMLGNGTTRDQASMFHLLDIDGSCIPSRQGIVISGRRPLSVQKDVTDDMIQRLDERVQLKGCMEDYTAHIEPDWVNDKQTSLVCFRDKGRIVQRMSPSDCDAAVLLCDLRPPSLSEDISFSKDIRSYVVDIDREELEEACVIALNKFHGGKIVTRSSNVWPAWNKRPLLIPTQNLPRARTCLKAMYLDVLGWKGHTPRFPYQLPTLLKGSFVLYDEEARPIVFA